MDIKSIKNRANEVLLPYKNQFIRILVIVLLLQNIPSLINGNNNIMGFLSFVLSIVFLPVTHGVIVASLKIVRNNGEDVTDDDAFVGFKRFKELFPTYIANTFVTFIILFVFLVIASVFLVVVLSQSIDSMMNITTSASVETIFQLLFANQPMNLLAIVIIFLVFIVLGFLLDAFLMAVPYLLEQYHITGFQAVKLSYRIMKDHFMDYVKLFFSFFGWMFLAAIIEGVLSELIPVEFIVAVLTGLFRVITYLPHFTLSQTVLFEEIAFYHFNQVGE